MSTVLAVLAVWFLVSIPVSLVLGRMLAGASRAAVETSRPHLRIVR